MPHYHAYYENFTEEQFAADEYFQQWVLAEDKPNNQFWKVYVDEHPAKFDILVNARRLVKDLAINPYSAGPLTNQEKSILKEAIYEQLGFSNSQVVSSKSTGRRRSSYLLIAATFILVIGALFYFISPPAMPKVKYIVEATGNKEIKEVVLPDSSEVVLNANSSLKFSADFLTDSGRNVYLQGNGYFKVRKLPGKTPFFVHADDLIIRVTGTEFNVNARTKATDIVLTEGSVNVTFKDQSASTAHMKAGESLTLDTVKQALVSGIANTSLYTTAWKDKEWHFQETSLENIAELIREYYGMEMIFANSRQKKMMMTAIVSVNDFSTLINVIAKTLNIKIKEERNQLLIY